MRHTDHWKSCLRESGTSQIECRLQAIEVEFERLSAHETELTGQLEQIETAASFQDLRIPAHVREFSSCWMVV